MSKREEDKREGERLGYGEEEFLAWIGQLTGCIDRFLNRRHPERFGFVLMLCDSEEGGFAGITSNGVEGEQLIAVLKEAVVRLETGSLQRKEVTVSSVGNA